jgi:hypothetical protein
VIEMIIDEENFHIYMFPSMLGIGINFGIAVNPKGGDCCIMFSLISKDFFQSVDVKNCHCIIDVLIFGSYGHICN